MTDDESSKAQLTLEEKKKINKYLEKEGITL